MNRIVSLEFKKRSQGVFELSTAALLVAVAMFCTAQSAQAQTAGSFSVSVGATHIAPSVKSGSLNSLTLAGTVPNAKIDVGSNTQATAALNYMATDAINLHLPLNFGFRHEVTSAGSIANMGKLADTRVLPITLIAQYRFMEPNAAFRPYVGIGLTYANFYKEKGTGLLTALTNPGGSATSLKFEDKLAPTVQLGGVVQLNDRWFVEGSYSKTFLKTQAKLSTGQSIEVRLNPDAFTLQVGYRF